MHEIFEIQGHSNVSIIATERDSYSYIFYVKYISNLEKVDIFF